MFDWLKRRANREHEIREEIEYHLEKLAEDEAGQGTSPQEARFLARRKLGNATLARERTREVWIWPALERFLQDLRYAMRGLRKHPAFTLTAVLSLALGIGANTAIFSLIDALLLRMLPVRDPQQLLELITTQNGRQVDSFSYPAIKALEQRADLLDGICAWSGAMFNAGPPAAVQKTTGAWVTGLYYKTLGVEPALGRLLAAGDDRPGGGSAGPVAVISYRYWENNYHRDPGVIGKALLVEGTPVTIVGVSARGFDGADVGSTADLTLPLAALPQILPERRRSLLSSAEWLRALVRPKSGISAGQAKAQLVVLWPGITKELVLAIKSAPRRKAILTSTIDLVPGATGWSGLRRTFVRPLMILMATVGLVLLIACVNVANLLLTRATARSREIAIRMAIGAGRGRLIGQLLTESVLLALLGAALGIAVAYAGDRMLIHLYSGRGLPLVLDVRPDKQILAFTLIAALLTGVLFGLAPAFRATSLGPGSALKDSHRHGWRRGSLASALVVSQVALSLLLLVGAGLFIRTLSNLENTDMGFQREGVLLVSLDARRAGYKETRLVNLYKELVGRIEQLPGVKTVSFSENTPLSGGIWSSSVLIDGLPRNGVSRESSHYNIVAPDYFTAMRTPLVLGRDFTLRDSAGSLPVAMVNEAFVTKFLGGDHPLGRRVSLQDMPEWQNMEIVGVVKNTVSFDLREPPPPFVYVPYLQDVKNAGYVTFEVRAQGPLARVADALNREIHSRLRDTALTIVPFTKQVQDSLVQERLIAVLAGFFASLALGLAAVGLYGLTSYAVSRRTSEIGIRMALGATRGDVLSLVLRGAFSLVAAGIVVGLPLAFAVSSFVSKMLFGVAPADPISAISAAGLLLLAAMIAAYFPARRASRVDPNLALRYE